MERKEIIVFHNNLNTFEEGLGKIAYAIKFLGLCIVLSTILFILLEINK